MATKTFLDFAGLEYYDTKLKASLANKKHSYTVAKSSAKNWYRLANANISQMETANPLHVQFMMTAWNSGQDSGYYQRWFVNVEVIGRNAGIHIFGNGTAPFSQGRILYENTIADIDANDRPALDLYLNYVLANADTNIEIEELYNSGWTFLADGALTASTTPTGFESVSSSIRNNGVERSTYCDWASNTSIQRSNFTANFTLADNNTYRAKVLNCTNAITVTVPSLNSVNCWFIIKNFNAVSTNKNVNVHPSTTSVLIDDSNADIILKPGEWVAIHSKAANSYSLIGDGRYRTQYGINKDNSTESANALYLPLGGTKQVYYTTTNGSTTLTDVPAAVNSTLESFTVRHLSTSDWVVNQILHNSNGLYYRRGSNSTWGAWKTFAFTDSNITGNAASATKATQDGSGNVITTTYATKSELPADYQGATSSANGVHGLVPAATSAERDKFFKGDGTWAELTLPSDYVGATSSANGTHGLVPAATSANREKYLRGDGTWQIPYTHPTGAGSKHIPAGGTYGQILVYSSNGTAAWTDLTTITNAEVDAMFE